MSSGSKKTETRYACLSEAKVSHSQKFGQRFHPLLHTSYTMDCLTAPLSEDISCPVRRSVTALNCFLLKDRNLALAPRQGPEINSRVCLWVSPRLRHHIQCWLTNQRLILLRVSCLETPKAGSGPTNFRTEPSLASSSAISLPHTPACPGTKYSPTACRVRLRELPEKNVTRAKRNQ